MNLGILILMNNYLHDLATAFLASSAILMLVLERSIDANRNEQSARLFIGAYQTMTYFAGVALIWILLGGAVRAWAFRTYEWVPAAGAGIVPALMTKHVILFIMVITGIFLWLRLAKKVRLIKQTFGQDEQQPKQLETE